MRLLDLVFPESCLECHKGNSYICTGCLARVRLAKPICPECKKASIDGQIHTKCSKKFGINGLATIWEYEGVIRKAILALKYKYSLEVGRGLADVFMHYLENYKFLIPEGAALVPIPIYWYRKNKRGFNQSTEIGKKIADIFDLEFAPDLLIRNKSTRPQVELKGDERRQNLKGVFSVNPRIDIPKTVLLFDDVFTTGSTLHEAAKVLKRFGAEKVWGLTIAR